MPLTRKNAIVRLIATCVILFGVIYLSAAAEPAPRSTVEETGLKRVEAAWVEPVESHREVRFAGVTRAAQRARVGFTIGGRVLSRPVEVGQRVNAGDVLARLDEREVRHAVSSASAALSELGARRSQIERDLERARRLYDAKAATHEEVEKTEAALEGLEAAEDAAAVRLAEAERLLDESTLTAPFAATVTDVLLEPGENVAPGQPVVVLSGDGRVEVEVEVPESVLFSIAPNDEVRVSLSLADREVPGRIRSVGRTAAGPGRLFPVVADLHDNEAFPGMTAELVLRLASKPGLAVPIEAVVNPGGSRPAVFRLAGQGNDWHVEKMPIEIGALLGEQVVVRGELGTEDRVVISGQLALVDGEQVEVR